MHCRNQAGALESHFNSIDNPINCQTQILTQSFQLVFSFKSPGELKTGDFLARAIFSARSFQNHALALRKVSNGLCCLPSSLYFFWLRAREMVERLAANAHFRGMENILSPKAPKRNLFDFKLTTALSVGISENVF